MKKTGRQISPVARFLARYGCFSIGTVYVLIGIWALLALLRLAHPAADEERILQRMADFPLGQAGIAVIAAGTAGYILWLFFEAVFDPYRFGRTLKGLAERLGIGMSALAYGVIVSAALKVLLGKGGRGEEQQRALVAAIMDWPGGRWLIAAAGLLVAGTGLYQIKYVHDRDHLRRLKRDGLGPVLRASVRVLAWSGYLARCAILLVSGGCLLRAAWSSDPRWVRDTDSAFDFLGLGGSTFGDSVFTVVALGTIGYGLFMGINGVFFDFGGERKA
jgi:hypothetical protein